MTTYLLVMACIGATCGALMLLFLAGAALHFTIDVSDEYWANRRIRVLKRRELEQVQKGDGDGVVGT